MAFVVKLRHIDVLSGGRRRCRRRWPKAVAEARGENYMQVAMKARGEGAALVAEHEALMAAYDAEVRATLEGIEHEERLSPRERWTRAQAEVARMLEGAKG